MQDELQALCQNQTWVLVPCPIAMNLVGSKWVLKTKLKEYGSLDKYEAQFMAIEFTQVLRLDYDETFRLVVKPTAIRLILTIALTCQWKIRQLDFKNAFLHGTFKDIVYMQQPLGFIATNYPNHVCLLKRSLYCLNHAPRAWFDRLSTSLINL